jgi:hypothetical protein
MSIAPDPITQIEPIVLRIPFDDGGKGHGIMPTRWNALDIMMLDWSDGTKASAICASMSPRAPSKT